MSPSVRFAGTAERIRAVLAHRAIYEIGGELDTRNLVGRPPVHPPYVLLAFAALARLERSTVRVETDFLQGTTWEFARARMIETIRHHGLDLPAPPKSPPAWHHWRRFRDDHLTTDEGIATVRRLHLKQAVDLAHDIGLLLPSGPGSLTHPHHTRAVYGDGTIVRPIYAPPEAIRTTNDAGDTVILYPDKTTGELRETPPGRFDPDIVEHHGHTGSVNGHGYVAFHARGRGVYERVVLTIDHIERPGMEAATAVGLIGDLHRALGDGIQVVIYDGAIRGAHIEEIMTRHGYPVIAKQPDYKDSKEQFSLALVRTSQGRKVRSHTLGTITHPSPIGQCSHILAAADGRVVEIDLDEAGDPIVRHTLERGPVKRFRRKDGRYHFNVGYHIPCTHGRFTVWLSPHAIENDASRPEYLRVLPDSDPDALHLRGIRSDAESNHAQFKRTLLVDRAMSLGWRRGLVDYYAYAWYYNALTEYRAATAEVALRVPARKVRSVGDG